MQASIGPLPELCLLMPMPTEGMTTGVKSITINAFD